MTIRSSITRVEKLEATRRRPEEILLVWRRPDADVRAAVSGAKFEPGDRVIRAEWFDDSPLPAPRWYRDIVTRAINNRDHAFVTPSFVVGKRTAEMDDNALLHACIGVAT